MNKQIKILSLIVLMIFSGCNQLNLEPTASTKPIIDNNLETIDNNSLKYISDVNQIALEWKKVKDKRVDGYYIYRTEKEGDKKLKRIAVVKNRLSNHFVDTSLEPNTKYGYKISAKLPNGNESRPTSMLLTKTKPRLKAVSFVQALSNLPREVKISWRPHNNPSINYYIIQRATPAKPKFKEIAKLEGRLRVEYIDMGLKDNATYKYRVVAMSFDEIETLPSLVVEATTKPLPELVSNITATNNLPRKIKLSWEKSKTKDVMFYEIYRANSSDGIYSKIARLDANKLEYEDLINEDGVSKFYKIVVIDSDNLKSKLSPTPIMGTTLNKPNRPSITEALIKDGKVVLRWKKGDNRAVSYVVYKVIDPDGFFPKTIKINDIRSTEFIDSDVVRGTTYSYSVEAVDKYGIHSDKTEESKLSLPKLQKEK